MGGVARQYKLSSGSEGGAVRSGRATLGRPAPHEAEVYGLTKVTFPCVSRVRPDRAREKDVSAHRWLNVVAMEKECAWISAFEGSTKRDSLSNQ